MLRIEFVTSEGNFKENKNYNESYIYNQKVITKFLGNLMRKKHLVFVLAQIMQYILCTQCDVRETRCKVDLSQATQLHLGCMCGKGSCYKKYVKLTPERSGQSFRHRKRDCKVHVQITYTYIHGHILRMIAHREAYKHIHMKYLLAQFYACLQFPQATNYTSLISINPVTQNDYSATYINVDCLSWQ